MLGRDHPPPVTARPPDVSAASAAEASAARRPLRGKARDRPLWGATAARAFAPLGCRDAWAGAGGCLAWQSSQRLFPNSEPASFSLRQQRRLLWGGGARARTENLSKPRWTAPPFPRSELCQFQLQPWPVSSDGLFISPILNQGVSFPPPPSFSSRVFAWHGGNLGQFPPALAGG